jgi:hypothetical protein
VASLQTNLAPVGNLVANDAAQATTINSIQANLGTATTNIATGLTETNNLRANITASNAAIITANTGMKSYVDSVTTAWTANAVTQAVQINTINSNLGTTTTNINTLFANAAAQADQLDFLLANVTASAINGNSFRTFSNANAAAQSNTIIQIQNTASSFQTYANANLDSHTTGIQSINANLGAYQTYANSKITPIANLDAVIGNLIPITSNLYSIGSDSKKWKELFTGGNIQSATFILAGTSVQTPLTETGNITSNTALIYNEALVGNIRTVDEFGLANLGNIITSSGVFWANGVSALSTYGNATVATYLPSHTGNATAGNITVTGNISTTNITLSRVVQLANLSQAQVANIAPNNGMMVYNHTYGNVQAYTSFLGGWGNVVVS